MMLKSEVIGSPQGSSVLPLQNFTKTTSCQCWKELPQQEETSIETNGKTSHQATPAGPTKGGAVGAVKGAAGKIQSQLANIGSLLQRGGINNKHSIFVTSSVDSRLGGPGQAAYCMSKHAINGYLECIRVLN